MEISQLDLTFFEKLLQNYLKNDKVTLIAITKSLASGKGDNFFSEIHRIFLRYINSDVNTIRMEEKVTLIIKSEITNVKKEAVHQMFTTEFKVLQRVLPRIEEFVGCTLGPKLLYDNENSNFIIMEDLLSKGYSMLNRQKGLSLPQCLVAIEKISKFHAGSVALTEKVF